MSAFLDEHGDALHDATDRVDRFVNEARAAGVEPEYLTTALVAAAAVTFDEEGWRPETFRGLCETVANATFGTSDEPEGTIH